VGLTPLPAQEDYPNHQYPCFPLGLNLEDDIVAEALIESKEFMLAHAEEEFELAC